MLALSLFVIDFLIRRGWSIERLPRCLRCERGNHVLFIDSVTGHDRYMLYVTETKMVFVQGA
jgi:hypothetical protein